MSAESLTGRLVRLRRKQLGDAPRDYAWRRDPELCKFDAVSPIRLSYPEYLSDYEYDVLRESRLRMRFAIETFEGDHIGNCSYYDIDLARRQAELGIMIGDKRYWGQGFGTDVVETLLGHVFRETSLERVYLYTLEWNERAQACFSKAGFREHSRVTEAGHRFVVMEIWRLEWEARTAGRLEPEESIRGS